MKIDLLRIDRWNEPGTTLLERLNAARDLIASVYEECRLHGTESAAAAAGRALNAVAGVYDRLGTGTEGRRAADGLYQRCRLRRFGRRDRS